jgi:hypothetical protein
MSTAQDVIVQVLIKARNMDDPKDYVLVEELAVWPSGAPPPIATTSVPSSVGTPCSTSTSSGGMLTALKNRMVLTRAHRHLQHEYAAPPRSMTGSVDLVHMGTSGQRPDSPKTSAGEVTIKYSADSAEERRCQRRVMGADECVYTAQSRWTSPGRFELQNRRELVIIAVDKVRRLRAAVGRARALVQQHP